MFLYPNYPIVSSEVGKKGRRTVTFYQVCTPGYPADLTEPLGKILSLGLLLKVIFGFQIFSNFRIKPYPWDRLCFGRLGIIFHGFRPKLKKSLKDQFSAVF